MKSNAQPLSELSDAQLLAHWGQVMAEIRSRGIVRTFNNPVADIAERLCANILGLTLETESNAGWDAVDSAGLRYQIKSRRITPSNGSRQLGAIRNLASEPPPFDFLLAAFMSESLELKELWRIPVETVRHHAVYRSHVNAHVLHIRGVLLKSPECKLLFQIPV